MNSLKILNNFHKTKIISLICAFITVAIISTPSPIGVDNPIPVGETPPKIITAKEKGDEIVYYNIPLNHSLQKFVKEQCKVYGLEELLVYGVIQQESRFDIKSIYRNSNGTINYGLGQINGKYMREFAEQVGIKRFNPFNPYHNLKVTIHQLYLHKQYWEKRGYHGKSLTLHLLNSYNMGRGKYSCYISRGGNPHRSYVKKILNHKEQIKKGDVDWEK